MQDYPHFVADPALLNTQLDFLTHLHGKEKIAQWHQLALTGNTAELVDELLRKHYDPGYLQSIRRNFIRLDQASSLNLPDISDDAFQRAARQLSEMTVALDV
jgi:tRNA 2-selenouridine synthase